jgi:LytR cell envelope-related transcriptional attenuator
MSAVPAAARTDPDCKALAPEGSAASGARDSDDHLICVVERGTERGSLRIFRDDAEVYTALIRPCPLQESKQAFSAIYEPVPDDAFIVAGVLPVGASAVEVAFARGKPIKIEASAVAPNSDHPVFAAELKQRPIGFDSVGAIGDTAVVNGCAPAFDTRPAEGAWRIYEDELYGFSAAVPTDWETLPVGQPADLLSALTYEVLPLPCGVGTSAAQVSVSEMRPTDGTAPAAPPRPPFGPRIGTELGSGFSANGVDCSAFVRPAQRILFNEGGRTFQVIVHIAPESTQAQRDQAYAILNSMRFVPEDELRLGRPARDVRVYVLNGSGHPTAIGSAEDSLDHAGYEVVGSRQASTRATTSVACRKKFKDDAAPLGRSLYGSSASRFPEPAPRRIKNADCIVYLGKDAPFEVRSRPVQSVFVLVFNASGVAQAAEVAANQLRGLGYTISGVGNAPEQDRSTVACREGYDKEAQVLADTLRSMAPDIEVASFPDPAPENAASAICIVTLGTAA